VHNDQRDAHMRHTINVGKVSYQPNSLGGGCPYQAGRDMGGFVSFPERIEAHKVRERSDSFRDHFTQARLFWNSQSDPEKEHIVLAFRFELGKVETKSVRERMVDLVTQVDVGLATQVAQGIGVAPPAETGGEAGARERLEAGWDQYGVTSRSNFRTLNEPATAPELSMLNSPHDSAKGRKVAILAADGVDGAQVAAMQAALKKAGAVPELIGPHLGPLKAADGSALQPDKSLLTVASVMYDAVYVPGGAQSVAALQGSGDALHFVNETFKHCKPLAASAEGVDLLLAADLAGPSSNGHTPEAALKDVAGVCIARAAKDQRALPREFVEALTQHRFFTRPAKDRVPA
jgi:catalase